MAPGPNMPTEDHRLAATFSAILPGLGQLARGHVAHAVVIFLISALLVGCAWLVEHAEGRGSGIFLLMLVVLPWWVFQSYDAWRPGPVGLKTTLRVVWTRGHDIRYLGALFFLTAFTDLYIILAFPEYSLTVFCTKPSGIWGILAKAQSPTLHTVIGYGFMRLRLWSLLVYLVYAGFGFLNASANFACFGYGRVRTVFLITLILFTIYVLWRKACFTRAPTAIPTL